MKYGLLYVTPINNRSERNFINLGDTMQTIAVKDLYRRMNISDLDIVPVELKNINEYDGEYIILPININLSLNWIIDIFPLPHRIIPVFIGLSYFSANNLPQKIIDYFKQYSPIGCRDEKTLKLMREHGITSYLSGCVTMTLTREVNCNRSKIFLVDVDPRVLDYIPDSIKKECEVVTLSHIYEDKRTDDIEYLYEYTDNLIMDYCQNAKLVITSRLHCISPCIAMGIKVIPVVENISPRMSWIDKFVKIYTYDDLDKIEWYQIQCDISGIKESMTEIMIERISDIYNKYNKILDLSYFYENRIKSDYGSLYIKKLKEIDCLLPLNFKYMIWGAGQIGMNLCEVIKEKYPLANLVKVIDSYAEGTFLNVNITKPSELKYEEDCIVFIATYSGRYEVTKKLEEVGYQIGVNCFCFASQNG